MLDQLNIALWSKVDVNSLGQEHDRITCSKLSSAVEQELQLQEDKTSNNSRVIKRAIRIAREFDYTDEVGFNLDSGLVNLKGGGEEEDVIVIDSDDEGNKKPPAKKYAMPPNITTTIVANPVLPNNVTNNNNNNQVAASYNVDTQQNYEVQHHQQQQQQTQHHAATGKQIIMQMPPVVNDIPYFGHLLQQQQQQQTEVPIAAAANTQRQNQSTSLQQPQQQTQPAKKRVVVNGVNSQSQYGNNITWGNVGVGRTSNNPAVLPNHTNNNKRNYQQMLEHSQQLDQTHQQYQRQLADINHDIDLLSRKNTRIKLAPPDEERLTNTQYYQQKQDPPSQLHNDAIQSVAILAQQEDVLFGRGGHINKHPGNLRYRDMINTYRPSYVSAQKIEKPNVARQVVKAIKEGVNPGRFLRKGEDNKWYEVSDKEAASKSSQALREKSKKCGKCCVDKLYNSYTKEQWWVTEDDERECKVCEKCTALLEQGKAQKPLEESHLMYCQFINGDGHYGKNANKNCSDVDDGWRSSPKCSNIEKIMQMKRSSSSSTGSVVVDDDDSTGDASLQFLVGGNDEFDPDDPVVPPPPPAIEQPPPVLTPFVELSPGVNGAVDNATIFSGMTFVLTGQFPEVPFGPEPQGVQGEQDYRSPDHRIIKNTIESFGGQVSESIPPCDYYLLRGRTMPIRSVVRSALRREQKIVRLCQLQRLLMGRRTLNNWDRQRSDSFNLSGAVGPNYTPPTGTVRRKEGTTYRLCRHGDCCPKLAVSPYNEWNWYCASHFYLNFEGRILRYELEVAHGFEERGLELFHNLPIKLNDKQTTYRPDFHRHGSNRVEMIEIDSPYHLTKVYHKRDPIRDKRLFEFIRRNGKHAFLLHFYHGRRPKPSAVLLDWLKSFFERRTTGDIASSQDEIWLINYPINGDTVKNMLCTFGKRIVKVGKLYEHDGVCYFEEIDCTAIYDAVMAEPNRPMGFYCPSNDGNSELAECHYMDSGKRPAYLLAMTYGMEDMNGDPFPTYHGTEQLRRIGTYLMPLKSDLVHAIEWHRRRRRKPCYEEYDVEYGKCLEMLGNLTYSEDVDARAAIEYGTLLEILGRLTGRSNEEGSGEETFEVFDAEEVAYLKGKVDELLQRPFHSDLDDDGLQEVREVRMRRPAVS